MAHPSTVGVGDLPAAFEGIRCVLEVERERTETEIEAFDAFQDRVQRIAPDTMRAGARGQSGGTGVLAVPGSESDTGLSAVKDAYEATVMGVSFYETEYGDGYADSVRGEFGPELGTALLQGPGLTPAVKRALVAATERVMTQRRAVFELCDREQDSLEDAAETLVPVDAELAELQAMQFHEKDFGGLFALRNHLLRLEETCDRVAARRQATINDHRETFEYDVEEPDIYAYLYTEFDATYPVLYLCTDIADTAAGLRRDVEHAMGSPSYSR